jgi:hypothetical protein
VLGELVVITWRAKVLILKRNSGEKKNARSGSTGSTSSASSLVRNESKRREKGKNAKQQKMPDAGILGVIVMVDAETAAAVGIAVVALLAVLLVPATLIQTLTIAGAEEGAAAAEATAAMKNPRALLAIARMTGAAGRLRLRQGRDLAHRLAVGSNSKCRSSKATRSEHHCKSMKLELALRSVNLISMLKATLFFYSNAVNDDCRRGGA